VFFRISESRTQVPTSGLPNFGALAAISTDIRINWSLSLFYLVSGIGQFVTS
jgi:hypothetical protein